MLCAGHLHFSFSCKAIKWSHTWHKSHVHNVKLDVNNFFQMFLQTCKQSLARGCPLPLKMLLFLLSLLRVPNVAHCSPDSWTIDYNVSLCIVLSILLSLDSRTKHYNVSICVMLSEVLSILLKTTIISSSSLFSSPPLYCNLLTPTWPSLGLRKDILNLHIKLSYSCWSSTGFFFSDWNNSVAHKSAPIVSKGNVFFLPYTIVSGQI